MVAQQFLMGYATFSIMILSCEVWQGETDGRGKMDKNFRVTNNNAVDMHVGKQVHLRRTLLGMSQEQLGASLNITFQQVQKYERGRTRSARLAYGISARFWMFRSTISLMT